MPDLGISVLLKGQNFMRMLAGLGVALKISLISVVISIPLGIVLGVLMTWKNPITKAILRIYLEIVRIMPQMRKSNHLVMNSSSTKITKRHL